MAAPKSNSAATPGNVVPRFDFTQVGSGAQSAGIASPQQAMAIYNGVDPSIGLNPWVRQRLGDWFSKHGGSPSDPNALYNAIDWGYRELQREKQKDPKFTSSGLLDKAIATALAVGGNLIAPGIGGAIGGALGGALTNHGDLKSAALGGVGGYLSGGTVAKLAGKIGIPVGKSIGFSDLLGKAGSAAAPGAGLWSASLGGAAPSAGAAAGLTSGAAGGAGLLSTVANAGRSALKTAGTALESPFGKLATQIAVPALTGLASGGDDQAAIANDQSAVAAQAEADRQQRITEGNAAIESALAGFNDDYFGRAGKDYLDYYTPQLDEQYKNANRSLVLNLSRSGNLASSSGGRQRGGLVDQYGMHRRALEDSSQSWISKLRSDVDSTRGELQQLVLQGADPLAVSQQAAARAKTLGAPASFSPLANVFADSIANLSNAAALGSVGYGGSAASKPLNFGNALGGAVRVVQ